MNRDIDGHPFFAGAYLGLNDPDHAAWYLMSRSQDSGVGDALPQIRH
ncbi:hypothetical protein [Asticcacaulis sp. DW145]